MSQLAAHQPLSWSEPFSWGLLKKFCQQSSYLSGVCGGPIPLLELWSSNSSTLCFTAFSLLCIHRTVFRLAACNNKTDEVLARLLPLTSILEWCDVSSHGAHLCLTSLATLDVTAAFLNAPLPAGRIVVLCPPTILYKLLLLPPGHVWPVHKAIYGLREAPRLSQKSELKLWTMWLSPRKGSLTPSYAHKSHKFTRQQSLQDHLPTTDHLGLTSRVLPHQVVTLSGIYAYDFLTAGPTHVVQSFLAALRKMGRTSDPQFSLDADLPFLGVSIRMTKDGVLLRQHHYTQDLLHDHPSYITARRRSASGEPDHFQRDPPLPPDPTNSEHQTWIKVGQRILGSYSGFTRARPDLAFAVSSAA